MGPHTRPTTDCTRRSFKLILSNSKILSVEFVQTKFKHWKLRSTAYLECMASQPRQIFARRCPSQKTQIPRGGRRISLAVQLSRGGVPKNGTQNGYMANAHCKPPALHSLQITPPDHTLFICKYILRKKPTKIHHIHVHLLLFTFSLDSQSVVVVSSFFSALFE